MEKIFPPDFLHLGSFGNEKFFIFYNYFLMFLSETVIMNPSKEVPEEIKIIDLQKKMKKKRFELKYNLEEQYRVLFLHHNYKKFKYFRKKI